MGHFVLVYALIWISHPAVNLIKARNVVNKYPVPFSHQLDQISDRQHKRDQFCVVRFIRTSNDIEANVFVDLVGHKDVNYIPT